MTNPRDLCIVGVAQQTVRPPGPAPEPLDSWDQVARLAADDAGVPDLLSSLDSIQVVYCQSWPYDDPAGRLAARLAATPRHKTYSGIGGTVPQVLVSQTAEAMQRGELDSALIVAAEALATKKALKRAGERPDWSFRENPPSPFPWTPPPAVELAHEVFQAWETFPLWDTARRARRGTDLATYSREMAAIMAAMTPTAAANPHAWSPVALTVDEVQTAGRDNRYVGWPYTKHEVSVMDVDMAAALLVTTHEKADALGIPADKRVYLASSSYAEDPAGVAERADMSASAAMRITARTALHSAGIEVSDVGCFDLYSCFPSSLTLACDAIGLDPLDRRGLTVTGGLPYAGGPGSGYMVHGIAATAERLRAEGGSAMVTGVGMHLQKHIAAVYRTDPGWAATPDVQAEVDEVQPRRALRETYDGTATVAAYTVAHDREGPQSALLVLDVPDGRTLARVREPELLADAESRELVGTEVKLTTDAGKNIATW
ncbi:MAG TPA: acetyl-CoA synthetase [Mycobacteriales bacterium]|nr:acetyl-CoA synthetase [Mycobacteriales bacterium]